MAQSLIGIKPLHNRVIVGIYDDGDTNILLGGKKFYLLDDTDAGKTRDSHQKHAGIRPRWGIVLSISDTVEEHGNIKPGDKILMDQLTWSRGMNAHINGGNLGKVWSIPTEDIIGVSDTGFTETDKDQISRLYDGWESWEVCVI